LRSVAVLGYSNTGKTTFIEVFTAVAHDAGLSTAVVKYSRHPGDFDRPGSDTHRFGDTPARFVAYSGRDAWYLTVPDTTVSGDAEDDRRADAPASPATASRDDEFAAIPPWLRPLADSIDILILEGRRLPESLVCLTTGSATTPEELKYPLDVADVVITTSSAIIASARRQDHGAMKQIDPVCVADEITAAQRLTELLLRRGETR